MDNQAKTAVLFVCLGNICRSPTAEGLFRHLLTERGLESRIMVDSAGTGDWHIGKAPDPRAQQAALERGYDISGLRARRVTAADFDRFDYILAMDKQNLANLELMRPPHYTGHLGLILPFGDNPDYREVPDPYYGGEESFTLVLDLLHSASQSLLDHICDSKRY